MASPNPGMVLPFVLLLLSMAVAPLLAPKWWHAHYPKVALSFGAITLAYYVFGLHESGEILHTALEYFSFIALIGSLFIVSGGIHLRVKSRATPLANTLFLLAGALLANVLGTTGAAMLLIRPWLNSNQHRLRGYHLAFFIFLVANVGGCLTAIGDPPLFLGYLQGVPFWWITIHAWPVWLLTVGILLGMFYAIDRVHCPKAGAAENLPAAGAWQFSGLPNLFFLAVILGAVFLKKPPLLRETIMLLAAFASYWTTRRHFARVHQDNQFDFLPLREVIILFAGIFATMMPALDLLKTQARDVLGAHPSPEIFYFGTGILSAILDNAPTYLGFLNVLLGATGSGNVAALLVQHAPAVLALSLGSVFFGAATYIGNGPNFMIKAIAEGQKAPAPDFFQFIWKFALPFLAPAILAAWLVFFR
ncbi:MAG: sodium:proton antiporter [Limisphaerales bacterium]